MPRARVYRHDLRCPRCGSNWVSKHGFGQGRQVYRCGDCRRRHVEGASYHRSSPEVVDRIMALYGEGLSLRAIGRVVGLSSRSVYFWVKKAGSAQALLNRGRRRWEGSPPRPKAKLISFD